MCTSVMSNVCPGATDCGQKSSKSVVPSLNTLCTKEQLLVLVYRPSRPAHEKVCLVRSRRWHGSCMHSLEVHALVTGKDACAQNDQRRKTSHGSSAGPLYRGSVPVGKRAMGQKTGASALGRSRTWHEPM